MSYNGIDQDRPDRHEEHPRGELGPVGDRATHQCGGDDRETELEGAEQQFGNRAVRGLGPYPPHPGMPETTDEPAE